MNPFLAIRSRRGAGAGGRAPSVTRGGLRPTPSHAVVALLALEGFLWLSERFGWFAFNQHRGWTVLIAVAGVGAFFVPMLLWFLAALVFRLRFQFGILSLLVLVVAVALPFSWLATEMRDAARQRDAVAALRALGGRNNCQVWVCYDYEASAISSGDWRRREPPGPAWARGLLGVDFFSDAVEVHHSYSGFYMNFDFRQPGTVPITDASLALIAGAARLRYLDLSDSLVTDAGMRHLAGLTHLTSLGLYGCEVTDAGLRDLRPLANLRVMFLGGTKVTDAGLDYLKGFRRLRQLYLPREHVTDAGVGRLQRVLPDCRIACGDPDSPFGLEEADSQANSGDLGR